MNEASRHDPLGHLEGIIPKWYKEVKPRFADLAHNGAVLRHLADASGEPIFVLAFDFKYMFHQWSYASSELWKLGSVMPYFAEGGGASDDVKAMTEEAMAMGFSGSSNIAQRFANALVQAFPLLFEQVEEKLLSGECEAV